MISPSKACSENKKLRNRNQKQKKKTQASNKTKETFSGIKEPEVVAIKPRAVIHSHKTTENQMEDENTRVQEVTENSSIARATHCLITVKFQMTALKDREEGGISAWKRKFQENRQQKNKSQALLVARSSENLHENGKPKPRDARVC